MSLTIVPQVGPLAPLAPKDRHPAAVYIARLAQGSRRTMRQALDTIAGILTDGGGDAETLPWAYLRYQHTPAVRTALLERLSPATANEMLAAPRGVLREAWRLGQVPPRTTEEPQTLPIRAVGCCGTGSPRK